MLMFQMRRTSPRRKVDWSRFLDEKVAKVYLQPRSPDTQSKKGWTLSFLRKGNLAKLVCPLLPKAVLTLMLSLVQSWNTFCLSPHSYKSFPSVKARMCSSFDSQSVHMTAFKQAILISFLPFQMITEINYFHLTFCVRSFFFWIHFKHCEILDYVSNAFVGPHLLHLVGAKQIFAVLCVWYVRLDLFSGQVFHIYCFTLFYFLFLKCVISTSLYPISFPWGKTSIKFILQGTLALPPKVDSLSIHGLSLKP